MIILFSLTNVSFGRRDGGKQIIGMIRQWQEVHRVGLHHLHFDRYIALYLSEQCRALNSLGMDRTTRVRLMDVEHDAA